MSPAGVEPASVLHPADGTGATPPRLVTIYNAVNPRKTAAVDLTAFVCGHNFQRISSGLLSSRRFGELAAAKLMKICGTYDAHIHCWRTAHVHAYVFDVFQTHW